MDTIFPHNGWLNVSTEVTYRNKVPHSVNLQVLNDESAARARKEGDLDYFDQKTGILYTSNRDKYPKLARAKIASISSQEVSADLEVRLGFDPGNLLAFKDKEFITHSCIIKQLPGYRTTTEGSDYILITPDNQKFPLMLVAGIRPEEERSLRGIDPDYFRDRVSILAQEPGLGLRTAFVFPTNDLLILGRPGLVTSILEKIKQLN